MGSKKIIVVFISALVLNFVYEYLHSALYSSYKEGPITLFILFRASVFDAVFITLLYLLFLNFNFLNKRLWLATVISLAVAVFVEIFALQTGRWAYNDAMPVIPIINIGLTPAIQLPILSYLIFKIAGI